MISQEISVNIKIKITLVNMMVLLYSQKLNYFKSVNFRENFIFARILFSRMALKDILATLKIATRT